MSLDGAFAIYNELIYVENLLLLDWPNKQCPTKLFLRLNADFII